MWIIELELNLAYFLRVHDLEECVEAANAGFLSVALERHLASLHSAPVPAPSAPLDRRHALGHALFLLEGFNKLLILVLILLDEVVRSECPPSGEVLPRLGPQELLAPAEQSLELEQIVPPPLGLAFALPSPCLRLSFAFASPWPCLGLRLRLAFAIPTPT